MLVTQEKLPVLPSMFNTTVTKSVVAASRIVVRVPHIDELIVDETDGTMAL